MPNSLAVIFFVVAGVIISIRALVNSREFGRVMLLILGLCSFFSGFGSRFVRQQAASPQVKWPLHRQTSRELGRISQHAKVQIWRIGDGDFGFSTRDRAMRGSW